MLAAGPTNGVVEAFELPDALRLDLRHASDPLLAPTGRPSPSIVLSPSWLGRPAEPDVTRVGSNVDINSIGRAHARARGRHRSHRSDGGGASAGTRQSQDQPERRAEEHEPGRTRRSARAAVLSAELHRLSGRE